MNNTKIKIQKIKDTTYSVGVFPKLARRLWFGIVSHEPLIDRLCVVLLLQYHVHLRHLLLLLLMPLPTRIL